MPEKIKSNLTIVKNAGLVDPFGKPLLVSNPETNYPSALDKKEKAPPKELSRKQQRELDRINEEADKLIIYYNDKLVDMASEYLDKWDGLDSEDAKILLDNFTTRWKMMADNYNGKARALIRVEREAFSRYIANLRQKAANKPQAKENPFDGSNINPVHQDEAGLIHDASQTQTPADESPQAEA